MDITVKIVTGKDAIKLIEDIVFISLWENLSNLEDRVTVIQKPSFVVTWYQCYSDMFNPVLCLGYDTKNTLVGIMPLALSLNNDKFTHAGAHQAEYHGWICRNDIVQYFPAACLIAIKKTFKLKKWQWGWIPPSADINWFFSPILAKENIYVKYEKQDSPILDLTDHAKLKSIQNNRSIKSKINRYEERGSLRIERVTDKDLGRRLLDIVRTQCDFRQLAVNNIAPFEEDPNKIRFYAKRLNFLNDNHFTVLWLNDKAIAFHIGACDRNTVYLGLTSFDPVENKNSPGSLLFTELASLMIKEGFRYFDLTPGGGEHKERLCNKYQKLVRPTLYFSLIEKLKADLNELLINARKRFLLLIKLNPALIKKKIDKIWLLLHSFKNLTLEKIARHLFFLIYNKRIYVLYRLLLKDLKPNGEPCDKVNVQNYSDLLLYTGSSPWLTRPHLLSAAMKQFAEGDVLYSLVRGGILAHYGWLSKGQKTHIFSEVDMKFDSPVLSVSLYGFYTEPQFRRQGLYMQTIRQMLYDSRSFGSEEAYIGAAYKNFPSRNAIEKIGFKPYRTFINTRFLWFISRKEIDD